MTSPSTFSLPKSSLSAAPAAGVAAAAMGEVGGRVVDGDDVAGDVDIAVVDEEEEEEEDLILDLAGEALVMMVNERPLNEMWERLRPLVAFLLNT